LLDIDQTLFFCDTFVELMKHYILANPSRMIALPGLCIGAAFYFAGLAGDTELKQKALEIFSGESRENIARISSFVVDRAFREKLNAPLLENIKKLTTTGFYDLIIVSASPSFYIERVGEIIHAHKTIATIVGFDPEGRLVPKIVGRNCKSEEKVERLKKEMDLTSYNLDDSYAFSDSVTDKPIFDLVGHPVAVNPDRKLLALAAKDARYNHFGKFNSRNF